MLDSLIAWSLRSRLLVVSAACALVAWGLFEAQRMPVDVLPDLTAPTVTVLADAHGMAPREVEATVTVAIESAMSGATGVRRVRSVSNAGAATVWVEFDWGTDVHVARQIVAERLSVARANLADDMPTPVMAPLSSLMGEVMLLTLESAQRDVQALRTLVETELRRSLLSIPGVARVTAIGGERRQMEVLVDPDRLLAYGLTAQQLEAALSSSNENASAGVYTEGGQEYLIYGLGRLQRLADIGEAVVDVRDGEPVLVRHVAELRESHALRRGNASSSGRDAVIVGVQKQPGANTLALTARIDERLREIAAGLPADVSIGASVFRQADFIGRAVDNVALALRDGSLLVVAIVLFFLAGLRATSISVLAIPLSLAAALLVIKALGATVNTMTLGGMAIAVGALVDDAIIDVENVVRRLRGNAALPEEARRGVRAVVYEASREIRPSIAFATLIIILVFVPLFFLDGIEGRLLRPLGQAYVVALLASLVVALTVTPVLSSLLLSRSRSVRAAREPGTVRGTKALYRPLLRATLHRWKLVTLLGGVAVLGAGASTLSFGQAFLPDFNEGTLTVQMSTVPGTALAESDALGRWAEELLLAHPEVTATARRTGRGDQDEHGLTVDTSEIDVALDVAAAEREALLDRLRADLARIPGARFILGQPISHRIDHMLSGTRARVAIKLFGDDLQALRHKAEEVGAAVAEVPGVADLLVEPQADVPFVHIRFDRPALARHGLSVRAVAELVEAAFLGRTVSQVLDERHDVFYDLVLRYERDVLADFASIAGLPIATPLGGRIRLDSVADVHRSHGPNRISREAVRRKIVVSCNVSERALGDVVADIRAAVGPLVTGTGIQVAYGGQFESAQAAARTLALVGLLMMGAVFALLTAALSSARDAFLVLFNLPFALVGGLLGVHLTGGVLSVAGLVGLIALFGIATRNGLMLVTHARRLAMVEGEGDPAEAVRRAAEERLVPILMTALATALALVPLALAAGEPGSEIQSPMAVVILCGLASSTVLNMLVLPALYLRFGAIRQLVRRTGPTGARTRPGTSR